MYCFFKKITAVHQRCPPLAGVPKAGVDTRFALTDWLYVNSFMKADKDNFHLYNSQLQPFASALRKEMTKAEACLWKYGLKARQLRGFSFRRQRPILNYITDFMSMDLMLVIEVDGVTHHWEETSIKDQKKQKDLENAGFTVIRLADEVVLNDINAIIRYLEDWIDRKDHLRPADRCSPPPPAEDSTMKCTA